MARAPSACPQTITQAIRIGEDSISVACTAFANRLLLIVSSNGKMGHLFKVSRESPVDQSLDSSDDVVSVDSLLGAEDEQVTVVGRYIAEKVLSALSRREILIGICLKTLSKPYVDELTTKILDVIRADQ